MLNVRRFVRRMHGKHPPCDRLCCECVLKESADERSADTNKPAMSFADIEKQSPD